MYIYGQLISRSSNTLTNGHYYSTYGALFTCRTRQVKLSILAKEAWCYNVPFMKVTIASWPLPVDEQGTNATVGTVEKINP